jgi:transcriptional regulator with XRE-family HTH domain
MGVSPEEYSRYEDGSDSPSLPQVETFAYGINIPLTHFTGNHALSINSPRADDVKLDLIRSLRQKMLGARIMQERTRLNLSTVDIAMVAGMSEAELNAAEGGELPLSFPRLQLIAELLDIPLDTLYDQQGIIGQWRKQQERDTAFAALSPELQNFICDPLNQPYIDLALRLSEMDAQKLRSIAESLLEITY